ncbi:hypothetical protein PVAP13_2KG348197 [Panicum virgatum]|uniref:Uncharacterized protein n=1 Tax=Panicum virgatum TaxID=38727 RepID=A0A8T0W3F0_PANVG|nr:hypothetical protein PVAP13_2KG348197 [Panicum virgatum]
MRDGAPSECRSRRDSSGPAASEHSEKRATRCTKPASSCVMQAASKKRNRAMGRCVHGPLCFSAEEGNRSEGPARPLPVSTDELSSQTVRTGARYPARYAFAVDFSVKIRCSGARYPARYRCGQGSRAPKPARSRPSATRRRGVGPATGRCPPVLLSRPQPQRSTALRRIHAPAGARSSGGSRGRGRGRRGPPLLAAPLRPARAEGAGAAAAAAGPARRGGAERRVRGRPESEGGDEAGEAARIRPLAAVRTGEARARGHGGEAAHAYADAGAARASGRRDRSSASSAAPRPGSRPPHPRHEPRSSRPGGRRARAEGAAAGTQGPRRGHARDGGGGGGRGQRPAQVPRRGGRRPPRLAGSRRAHAREGDAGVGEECRRRGAPLPRHPARAPASPWLPRAGVRGKPRRARALPRAGVRGELGIGVEGYGRQLGEAPGAELGIGVESSRAELDRAGAPAGSAGRGGFRARPPRPRRCGARLPRRGGVLLPRPWAVAARSSLAPNPAAGARGRRARAAAAAARRGSREGRLRWRRGREGAGRPAGRRDGGREKNGEECPNRIQQRARDVAVRNRALARQWPTPPERRPGRHCRTSANRGEGAPDAGGGERLGDSRHAPGWRATATWAASHPALPRTVAAPSPPARRLGGGDVYVRILAGVGVWAGGVGKLGNGAGPRPPGCLASKSRAVLHFRVPRPAVGISLRCDGPTVQRAQVRGH